MDSSVVGVSLLLSSRLYCTIALLCLKLWGKISLLSFYVGKLKQTNTPKTNKPKKEENSSNIGMA